MVVDAEDQPASAGAGIGHARPHHEVGLLAADAGDERAVVGVGEPGDVGLAAFGERVPVGTDATLGPGDSFVFPPFVAGEWRNASSEPVVFTVVLIAPAGEGAATPTP